MMKILYILLIIAALVVLITLVIGWWLSAPVYKGPVSDHFDGKRFLNPGGAKAGGFGDLMKWVRTREQGEWKEITTIPAHPLPPERVNGDSLMITFVGHSTFLIQTQGLNILTDPVWSERASPVSFAGPKRMVPPGIAFGDLPPVDMVLLTHNHYDHLDIKTMQRLNGEHGMKVYCPLGVGGYLKRKGIEGVTEMDWWDELPLKEGLNLVCTPAQHFSGRGMFDRDRTLWAGFALLTDSGNIYYSGDTGYGEFFGEIAKRLAPVRLAFLPIGAYKPEWFMAPIHTSPADAFRVHREMNPSMSIAMHFGTFPLADDGMGVAEKDLQNVLDSTGVQNFIIPEPGKTIGVSSLNNPE
jgi:L-ascorbate metabolism protein UlaG (beta-lactamase superfamily)